MLADSGLRMSAVCRTGYVSSADTKQRSAALQECWRAIADTAAMAESMPGSRSVLVFVGGGPVDGEKRIGEARARVADALGVLAADAEEAGVTLAVEALHPMYATDLAVVSALPQAIDLAESVGPAVGVVLDSFHI